jgi:hypothetical protein
VDRRPKRKANVLDFFARQAQAMGGPPSVDIHDVVGNDDHVVVLGSASASAPNESCAERKYVQSSKLRMESDRGLGHGENDAAVDPFLDGLPD